MKCEAYGTSEIGKRRLNNDRFKIDVENGIYIIADGVGSKPKAGDASQFAVEEMYESLVQRLKKQNPQDAIFSAAQFMNEELRRINLKTPNPVLLN